MTTKNYGKLLKQKDRVLSKLMKRILTGSDNSDCWFWITKEQERRTLVFTYDNNKYSTKRAIFTLFKGVPVANSNIKNKCRNYKCVNPDHLIGFIDKAI